VCGIAHYNKDNNKNITNMTDDDQVGKRNKDISQKETCSYMIDDVNSVSDLAEALC
jgi:hypothetical protein